MDDRRPPGGVRVTVADRVARIVLDRPDRRNAFDAGLIATLTEAVQRAGADPDVRVVVLSGAGPVFSAGADLAYMRACAGYAYADNVADARRLAGLFLALRDCPRPVVARVHGAAMGGGAGLVAAADIAVAAAGTRFALSEARLGLLPAVIAPFVLPRIGATAARELFLTGEVFDAAHALGIGLVARVVPDADLDGAVAERVAALLAAGPEAQAAIKRLLPSVAGWRPELVELAAEAIAERRASAEAAEGLSAFLERRAPGWALAAGAAGAADGRPAEARA